MTEIFPESYQQQELIGLIPAAGKGSRLSPLPFSKELYPIGFLQLEDGQSVRPKPVCLNLLERMKKAGVTRVYIVLREGKWDIPSYLGNGSILNMYLAYIVMGQSPSVPYTLDQAFPFIKESRVAFGFPDIIFEPDDAFVKLLERQTETGSDVVLGMFPVDSPDQNWDMVDCDEKGNVQKISVKSKQTISTYTWIIAVWTPVFTNFMHQQLAIRYSGNKRDKVSYSGQRQQEFFISDMIQEGIKQGLRVIGIEFAEGTCLDIGTPDGLERALCL